MTEVLVTACGRCRSARGRPRFSAFVSLSRDIFEPLPGRGTSKQTRQLGLLVEEWRMNAGRPKCRIRSLPLPTALAAVPGTARRPVAGHRRRAECPRVSRV